MIPAILAALGEAGGVAGSVGAATGSAGASALGKQAGQLANIGQSATGLVGKLKDLVNPLKHVEGAAHKLYDGLNFLPAKILEVKAMIVSTGQHFVAAVAAPIDAVNELGQSVARLVRFWNPAAVTRFEISVANASATLGRTLQPVLEALGRAADAVGNEFARLRPAMEPAIQAVASLIDTFARGFGARVELLAPVIQTVSVAMLGFAKAADFLLRPLDLAIRGLGRLAGVINPLASLVGPAYKADARRDFAVQPASFVGTEDIQRNMAKNALTAAGGMDPKDQAIIETPNKLQEILTWLDQNVSFEKLGQIVQSLLPNLPRGGPGVDAVGMILRGLMHPGR